MTCLYAGIHLTAVIGECLQNYLQQEWLHKAKAAGQQPRAPQPQMQPQHSTALGAAAPVGCGGGASGSVSAVGAVAALPAAGGSPNAPLRLQVQNAQQVQHALLLRLHAQHAQLVQHAQLLRRTQVVQHGLHDAQVQAQPQLRPQQSDTPGAVAAAVGYGGGAGAVNEAALAAGGRPDALLQLQLLWHTHVMQHTQLVRHSQQLAMLDQHMQHGSARTAAGDLGRRGDIGDGDGAAALAPAARGRPDVQQLGLQQRSMGPGAAAAAVGRSSSSLGGAGGGASSWGIHAVQLPR